MKQQRAIICPIPSLPTTYQPSRGTLFSAARPFQELVLSNERAISPHLEDMNTFLSPSSHVWFAEAVPWYEDSDYALLKDSLIGRLQ